jgi:hypothetical protein
MMLAPSAGWAAEVRASVDKSFAPEGRPVVLTVEVVNAEGEPDVSVIEDFRVARSGKSTSVQIINGRRTSKEAWTYLLVPQKTGELSIPAVPVSVDGQVMRTEPITVTVEAGASGSQQGGAPEGDVALQAKLGRKRVYLGEPVLYTVEFATAVRVADFSFEPPEFEGFSQKDLGRRSGRQRRGGRVYEAHRFPWLLTPLSAGNHTIAPAQAVCKTVSRGSGSGRRSRSPFDIFDDPFFGSTRLETRSLSTDPVSVEVRPLPEYTGKAPFTGIVGEVEISAELSEERITQGDSATLRLTLSGRGGIMDATAPELDTPSGLKMYMDAPEENVQAGLDGYSGSKTFRYALVGLEPGTYAIGPVRLAWFDPSQERYVSGATQAMRLEVAPGGETAADASAGGGPEEPGAPREVEARYQDILPLKESPSEALEDRPVPSPWVFAAGLVLPPLAFGCLVLGLRLARRDRSRAQELARQARSRAREASALAGEAGREAEAYAGLRQALLDAVQAPLGAASSSLTRDEVREALEATGRDRLVGETAEALDELESARYGGRSLDATAQRELARKIARLVKELTA